MSLYLKKFSTHTEYEQYINGSYVILPNVSICKNENDTHYNPYIYIDPYNGHDYVEIGGLKWATMNIGATSITDTGLYFQWGDTQGYTIAQIGSDTGQKYFSCEDYKYNPSGDGSTMTKYNDSDGKTVLEPSDDAATVAWGGSWRMPTTEEYVALGNAVNKTWSTNYQDSGVAGMIFTDKTDSSKELFFPACGSCNNGIRHDVGERNLCWASSLSSVINAHVLYFGRVYYYNSVTWNASVGRYVGCCIRGVIG